MAKERYNWPDIVRFIGIWMVFSIHSNNSGQWDVFFRTVTLQLFFFCAGMFSTRGLDMPFKDFLLNLFRKLMVPYFFFAVLSGIMQLASGMYPFTVTGILWRTLCGIRDHMHAAALWFFPGMFCLAVYFYIVTFVARKVSDKQNVRQLVTGIAVFLVWAASMVSQSIFQKISIGGTNTWCLPWSADKVAEFLPYYWAGSLFYPFFCKLNLREEGVVKRCVYILIALCCVGVLITSLIAPMLYYDCFKLVGRIPCLPLQLVINSLIVPVPALLGLLILCKLADRPAFLAKVGASTLLLCCSEAVFLVIMELAQKYGNFAIPGFPVQGVSRVESGIPYGMVFAVFELFFIYFLLVPFFRKFCKKFI